MNIESARHSVAAIRSVIRCAVVDPCAEQLAIDDDRRPGSRTRRRHRPDRRPAVSVTSNSFAGTAHGRDLVRVRARRMQPGRGELSRTSRGKHPPRSPGMVVFENPPMIQSCCAIEHEKATDPT